MVIMLWLLLGILIGWALRAGVGTIETYYFQRDLRDLASAIDNILYDPEDISAQDWLADAIISYWDKYGKE